MWQGIGRLSVLNLGSNSLVTIETGSLGNLNRLKRLYLFNNDFTTINCEMIEEIPLLELLDFGSNNIGSIPEDCFSKLTKLKSLFLYDNGIGSLMPGIFNGLHSLRELNLGTNSIETIPEGVLSQLKLKKIVSVRKRSFRNSEGILGRTRFTDGTEDQW